MPDSGVTVTVHEELERVQAKCARLRNELQAMHAAFDKSEMAALRAERDAYRKALSNIAHRLATTGAIDAETLRKIVRIGLACRNIKPSRRQLLPSPGREGHA